MLSTAVSIREEPEVVFRSCSPFRVPTTPSIRFLIVDEIPSETLVAVLFLPASLRTNVVDVSLSRVSSVDKKPRKLIVMAEVREPRAIDTLARKSITCSVDRSSNPDAILVRRRCFNCAIIYLADCRDFRCTFDSDLLYANYVY